jgi:hypothetical protein
MSTESVDAIDDDVNEAAFDDAAEVVIYTNVEHGLLVR